MTRCQRSIERMGMKVNRSLYQSGRYQEILEQLSSAQGQPAGEYMAAVKKRAVIYNSSKVRTESPEAFITDMVNNDLIQLS